MLVVGAIVSGSAAAAPAGPPLKTALEGHWLTYTIHGSYTWSWSANVSAGCGEGLYDEVFNGQASQTITFGSSAPVRLYSFRGIYPAYRKGPRTFLLLSRRYYAPGTHLGPNDFGGGKVRAPALYTRSIAGTYRGCGLDPAVKTLPPTSCARLRLPRFQALIGWDPQAKPTMNVDGIPGRELYSSPSCALPEDFPEDLTGQRGLPNWEEGFVEPLGCPPLLRFTHVRVGERLVCRHSGRPSDAEHPRAGAPVYHETITLVARGSR